MPVRVNIEAALNSTRPCHSPRAPCFLMSIANTKRYTPVSLGQENQKTSVATPKAETPQNQSHKLSPAVEFVWPWDGEKVEVAGTWNNWRRVPMIYDQNTGTHRLCVPSLPHGHTSYKFVVDGQWRYDANKPVVADDRGNVNNLLLL